MIDEPAHQADLQQDAAESFSHEHNEQTNEPAIEFEIAGQEPKAEQEQQYFRFLTDHNVPVSLGRMLTELGHDVVRVSDVMPADSPDPVVARAAIEDSRILISWDRDFNAQRLASPRFAALSRIMMSGPEHQGAERLANVFDVVDFALRRGPKTPIIIRIGVGRIQIHI